MSWNNTQKKAAAKKHNEWYTRRKEEKLAQAMSKDTERRLYGWKTVIV